MELDLLSLTRRLVLGALAGAAACQTAGPAAPPAAPATAAPTAAPVAAASAAPEAAAEPLDASPNDAAASLSSDMTSAVEAGVPAMPRDSTVLHIGDSMAGALGIELNKQFTARGVKGILRYKTASFIPTWAWGKEIPLYMAQYDPDLVIITLGANEVAIKDPNIRASGVRKLVRELGGRPCVWVAPPLWAGDTGLLPVIKENCAPCLYMDTNALVGDMPRVSDKIHPTMNARKLWAKFVADWLATRRKPAGARAWELEPLP